MAKTFSPFVAADICTLFPADVLKKCALVGMHLGRGGKSGFHTPDLGDMWRYSCPKSSIWESEDEAWSGDESVSSSVSRENNGCNGALHVIGLYGRGDKVSLPGGLGACSATLPWMCCAKKCMRHGSWVDAARGASVSQQGKPLPFTHGL